MPEPVETKYLDVLQNIEFAIVQVYRVSPELTDARVDKTFEALIRLYRAEESGRTPPETKLSNLEQDVFGAVKMMCDWRLGRCDQPVTDEGGKDIELPISPISVSEIILCLKRLRRSIELWTKQGGRQGYLNYIDHFIK